MFKIPTKLLLLVAALVWLFAGALVISVGLQTSADSWTGTMVLAFLLTYLPFLVMFLRISRKHIKRILGYTEKFTGFFKFFDTSSYLTLAVMVGLGASVRISGLVPAYIIEFFYTGLGFALVCAAVYYIVTYVAVSDVLGTDDDNFGALVKGIKATFMSAEEA
ncbi:MAG: hypothetical protein FWG24_01735 [Eggerthellaceae bacterium]|nr:hypothetical protein [Eggerthellaceae bacterium]